MAMLASLLVSHPAALGKCFTFNDIGGECEPLSGLPIAFHPTPTPTRAHPPPCPKSVGLARPETHLTNVIPILKRSVEPWHSRV